MVSISVMVTINHQHNLFPFVTMGRRNCGGLFLCLLIAMNVDVTLLSALSVTKERPKQSILLPSQKYIEVYEPDISTLLQLDLVPNRLVGIALRHSAVQKLSNNSDAINEESEDEEGRLKRIDQLIGITIVEKLSPNDTIEEDDKSIILAYALGAFQLPNAAQFESFVAKRLFNIAASTDTPPSCWGSFSQYKDTVTMFDLDQAFFIYRSVHVSRDKIAEREFIAALLGAKVKRT
jgi:hypothetical protein